MSTSLLTSVSYACSVTLYSFLRLGSLVRSSRDVSPNRARSTTATSSTSWGQLHFLALTSVSFRKSTAASYSQALEHPIFVNWEMNSSMSPFPSNFGRLNCGLSGSWSLVCAGRVKSLFSRIDSCRSPFLTPHPGGPEWLRQTVPLVPHVLELPSCSSVRRDISTDDFQSHGSHV